MKKSKIRMVLILAPIAVFAVMMVWAIAAGPGALSPLADDGEEPPEAKMATTEKPTVEVLLADLVSLINDGKVAVLDIWPDRAMATLHSGEKVLIRLAGAGMQLVPLLRNLGVRSEHFAYDNPESVKVIHHSVFPWGTFALILVLVVVVLVTLVRNRKAQADGGSVGSAGGPMAGFGKSRAKKVENGDGVPKVTFGDVAGCDEAVTALREVVDFLKDPEKYRRVGARIPKGVLLMGAPGTGKTLLARAVAGEAGVPFFSASGSEFVEMYVGVGASRVRDLFEKARANSPCIIFLDEVESMTRERGAGASAGGKDEQEQTMAQILTEMDGFSPSSGIIVLAATNRPDIIDPAFLRPGRFDRKVVLDRPDMAGREAILKVHVRGKPLADDVNLRTLARSTPGFVGADIENLVNEAAILAAHRNRVDTSMAEFEEAIDCVLVGGSERRSRQVIEEERRVVAYHEAGHALTAHFLDYDPVHKISIVARGMAGGYTIALPEEDRGMLSKSRLKKQLVFGLGGRAAEEIAFGPEGITTGATNDLERVSQLAERMVNGFGMGSHLLSSTKSVANYLSSGYVSGGLSVADAAEAEQILQDAAACARKILEDNRNRLERLVQLLLDKETVGREEFLAIVDGPAK